MSVKSVKFRTVPFWHELKQSDKQAAPQRVVIAGQTETYDSIKEAEVYAQALLSALRDRHNVIDPQVDVLQVAQVRTASGSYRERAKTVRQFTTT